jgi:signal transduction histidine kinase/CheY-like chemotaxis protein
MQRTMPLSEKDSPEYREWITDLLRDTQRKLVIGVTGIYLLWLFVAGLRWPETLAWQLWAVFAAVLVVARGSLVILARNLLAAQVFWLGGVALTIILTIYLFARPEMALFFMLLPLLAVLLSGQWGGLIGLVCVTLLTFWLGRGPFAAQVEPYVTVIIAGGAICGILGWIASDTLVTQYHYTLYYSRVAMQNLEEARQHRGQLVRVLKDLDMAYYRLERANADLVAAWKDAERAERVKSEILTFVSHEMRTPLNLVSGFSEMMLRSPASYGGASLPPAYEVDLRKIARSAAHLLALVDDVIDLARFDVGRIGLSLEWVDLAALARETAGMVSDYISTKGLELRCVVAPDLPLVWIDRLRIRQVLLNLLVNAARFTEQGNVTLEVMHSAAGDTADPDGKQHRMDQVTVRVSDTGRGIAVQDLPRVFEEYHTTEQTQGSWHSGSGLGLPISKKLIELHQGTIGVESTAGQGATFWFTLPIPGSREYVSQEEPGPARRSLALQLQGAERVCLVVNEDPRVALLMQRYVRGFRWVGAANAAEAPRLADESRAIALLTGHHQALPELPKHLLVARCALPAATQAADSWSVTVLPKPVLTTDLLAAVDRVQTSASRVLVVDDDPEMIDLYRRILSTRLKPGDCLTAHDGRAALALARQHKPDLILLDLVMPELDGYGVLAALRADPELATIPVIVLSGRLEEDVGLTLDGPITLARGDGFTFGEVARTLETALNTLAPGWQAGPETAARPPAVPPG